MAAIIRNRAITPPPPRARNARLFAPRGAAARCLLIGEEWSRGSRRAAGERRARGKQGARRDGTTPPPGSCAGCPRPRRGRSNAR